MATVTPSKVDLDLDNGKQKNTAEITLHPIVGDRIIEGDGTSSEDWQNWQGLQKLLQLEVAKQFPRNKRVCIFAPHPDDEVLGCGGLLQQLTANGNSILIVYVTRGTQSHPDSSIYPPNKLGIIRAQESVAALKALKIAQQVTTTHLDLTDGDVFSQKVKFINQLTDLIHPDDILVTPFVHDGHPDHEVTGQVVADFAKTHHLPCYQVLIWAWHWAQPNDQRIPWQNAFRLDLTADELQHKSAAIFCFTSQITTDQSTGNPPILSAKTIARISQRWEVYLHDSRD